MRIWLQNLHTGEEIRNLTNKLNALGALKWLEILN